MAISHQRVVRFTFDCRVGFSGTAEQVVLPVQQLTIAAGRHFGKFRRNISLEWFPDHLPETERSFARIWERLVREE